MESAETSPGPQHRAAWRRPRWLNDNAEAKKIPQRERKERAEGGALKTVCSQAEPGNERSIILRDGDLENRTMNVFTILEQV